MTGNQFIAWIITQGNQITLSGQTITDQVNLTQNIISDGVIIEDCVFEEGVFLEKIDLNCGIRFVKCTFKKNLSINKCKAQNYDQVFNFNGYHLDFKNTKINGLYFNDVNQLERGVRICEKSNINRLHLRTLIASKGGFAINDSTIENLFDISQAVLNNDVSIREDSIIDSKVRFENVTCGSFVFTESHFKKDIHIWAGKTGSLIFNDGIFEDDLSINAVPISSNMTIFGTDFKKSINFTLHDKTNNKKGSLNQVFIKSGKFGEQFIVNGSGGQLEELTIITSKQLEGDLYFNSININTAKLSGDNYKSNIVFNHSNFNSLNFDFFNNYSTLSIISAKSFNKNSELALSHSNLGKTHLFNTFLNTFEKVKIYNSVLTEIIVANVKWFEDNQLNANITASSEEYTQRKEIYRQIKFALEKQGDRISSLRFKALEMSAYKNEMFAKVKWYCKIFNIDRFILWVGQTNNFGQNWLKPALIAIGFTLLFYSLIVVGLSEKLVYCFNFDLDSIGLTWNEFVKHAHAIPQLLNPAHVLSRIFPEYKNIGFGVYLFDYLQKIFLAFFIFQIISAFRKYMK